MIDGSPSRTALLVAAMRANHFLFAEEPKILRDSLAMSLSGLGTPDTVADYIEKITAGFTALSDRETAETFVRRISDAVCMRSRLVEAQLQDGHARGLKQMVVLGAGLDSTAYRCSELTENMEIFEVDHPATQGWKRERLEAIGVEIPDNLTFVSFDFNHQTLAQALDAGGVSKSAMTLFSWLGVHMYLADDTVKATLNVLGGFPSGSELVMDFIEPEYDDLQDAVPDSIAKLNKLVTTMGEPFKSTYFEADLEQMLKTSGFAQVDFCSAGGLAERFFPGQNYVYSLPDEATSLLTARI